MTDEKPEVVEVTTEAVNSRVGFQVLWRGRVYNYLRNLLADTPHHILDRAVYDAMVQVRRALARAKYPDAMVTSPLRDEWLAWGDIENHVSKTGDRFELVPPGPDTNKWRAYFKKRPWATEARYLPGPGQIESNPAVGLGSTLPFAIENLLRFVEGKEPVDG